MKKRKLNGKALALICFILLIVLSAIKVPRLIDDNKLKGLGYSEEAISAIRKYKLKNEIIRNEYYSDVLNQEIVKDSFNKQYYRLYLVRDGFDDQDLELYERLKEIKGYSDEELLTLFGGLSYENLLPLVVFDKVDPAAYVEDCKSHPANSLTSFKTSNNYLGSYEDNVIENPESIEAYVSRKFSLGDYEPADLETIPNRNAISGIQLRSEALDAFNSLCAEARNAGNGFYAVAGYRSYAKQKELYEGNGSPSEPDGNVLKPGYNDLQTGLSVLVVASENNQTSLFKDTAAYKWVLNNAHKYGFIIRYPENMSSVTGNEAMPYYLRYVGEDLATRIYNSKLAFDEYYMMFIYQKGQ